MYGPSAAEERARGAHPRTDRDGTIEGCDSPPDWYRCQLWVGYQDAADRPPLGPGLSDQQPATYPRKLAKWSIVT
jgi:hypothetical protein